MPELPEVETIAAVLRLGKGEQPSILGRVILAGQVLWERTLASPVPEAFLRRIVGQRIEMVERRGKFLVFRLAQDTLLIHLRMSGDLCVEPITAPLARHHRLVLDMEGGLRLAFNDARKFGRVWLTSEPENVLGGLGPEPLSEAFTSQMLHHLLHRRHRRLKLLLLDQRFLAGLGNIYADEALHLARLHPLTFSDMLTADQSERLWVSLREVLRAGIQRNGASIDWVYRGGEFQNEFRVYHRTGQPCYNCGTPIQRLIVGQRSTHYCPLCQPLSP